LNIKKISILFYSLFFLLGISCTSFAQQINKTNKASESINLEEIENRANRAFQLYHEGRIEEAAKELQDIVSIIPKEPPSGEVASYYAVLAFFQERLGNPYKATLVFESANDLFQVLKSIPIEKEALLKKLTRFEMTLKGKDKLGFYESIRPIFGIVFGKAGESFLLHQIAEIYFSFNNYQEAYERAKESMYLAREVGVSNVEVMSSITLTASLISLGRTQETEAILQEVLPKTQRNPGLKVNVLLQLGIVNANLGREDRSIQFFREAHALNSSIGDMNLLAISHMKTGLGYALLKKYDLAIREALISLDLFEKLKNEVGAAAVETGVADYYFKTGAFGECSKHAQHAAEVYKRLGNRIEEAKNLRIAGQCLAELNRDNESLKLLDKAVEIFVEERNLNESNITYWFTIDFLKKLGRFEDIRRSLITALTVNEKYFKDKMTETRIRTELGYICDELGLYSEALKEKAELLSLYKKESNIRGEIHTLVAIARTFATLADYERWLNVISFAEQKAAMLDDPKYKLMIIQESANIFKQFGRTIDAISRMHEGLRIAKTLDKETECFWLGSIGYFYLEMGEYEKALEYFENGLNIGKEINDLKSVDYFLAMRGNVFSKLKKYDEALRVGRELHEISKKIKSKTHQSLTLGWLSSALINKGFLEEALQYQIERLQLDIKSPQHIKNIYESMGLIYLKMGKNAEAVDVYKKAIHQMESIRGKVEYDIHKRGFIAKELSSQISAYDGIVEALYNSYLDSASNSIALAEEALVFAEKSKARVWIEELIRTRGTLIFEDMPLEVKKEFAMLFVQAQNANREYEQALITYLVSDEEIERKDKGRISINKKLTDYARKLANEYPKFGLVWSEFDAPLKELPIRNDETCIIYKFTPYWTYAWVIKRITGRNEVIKFIRLPNSTREIEKAILKMGKQFSRKKYDKNYEEMSREVFINIFEPVLQEVKINSRLVIIPDGILSYVPFEILIGRGDSKNELIGEGFLGDRFAISYYPSLNILIFNRRIIPQSLPLSGSILAVGDPVYGREDKREREYQGGIIDQGESNKLPATQISGDRIWREAQTRGYNFGRLKHSGKEAIQVSKVFEGTSGYQEVLLGLDASEGRVKSMNLSQYKYLHFAVHGILAYDVPQIKEPSLVLAYDPNSKEDGFLTVSEIGALKINADLVTLSACETGVGKSVLGEGIIGLGRAFMNAGAKAVIVSMWEVADESTAILMQEFYRLLAQGVEKVGALKKAKEYLRMNGYKDPYYWAPFILIGG